MSQPLQTAAAPQKLGWRFPRTFWFANAAELFERAAFYGMFITLLRYLDQTIGFGSAVAGMISGAFAALMYFVATLTGALVDRVGFRRALVVAFTLLTAGYALLGALPYPVPAVLALALVVVGGAIVKPCISGTAAKTSSAANRARAMSIFYMIVNIGSFSGKGVAAELNTWLTRVYGVLGLRYINYYAAVMSFAALLVIVLFYRDVDTAGVGKSVRQTLAGLARVLKTPRFMALIVIISGFWIIQYQLYGAMPTYVERVLGQGYRPEWLANINPFIVVLCVVPITHLVRRLRPVSSIGIALGIIPWTALLVGLSPHFRAWAGPGGLLGLNPIVLTFMVGIALQGLAECFLSPKWLEYVSKQAPPGETGLYLGYSYLTSCCAAFFGLTIAGQLLAAFCPDPAALSADQRQQWRLATQPRYVATLPPEFRASLDAGTLAPALRQALAAAGANLSPDAAVVRSSQAPPKWKLGPAPVLAASGGTPSQPATASGAAVYEIEQFSFPGESSGGGAFELVVHGPQPRPAAARPALPSAYARANYVWYVYAAIGFAAFLSLLTFKAVTDRIDRRREIGN